MGGRRPASPQIVPGQPPQGGGPAMIGGIIGGIKGRRPFGGERNNLIGPGSPLYDGPQRPPTRGLPPGIGDPPPRRRRKPTPDQERFMDIICPDPNMHILMANGSQKRAGDLKVGDLVKTYHEKDLEKAGKKSLVLASGSTEKYSELREQLESSYAKATLGDYKVEFVDIIKDVEKIKLTFEGSEIICSLSHKFYVDDSWKEAKNMVIGDEVSSKKLVAIEDVEDGDVVYITVEDAHTYICEGLLSHNKSPRRGPDDRRGRGRGRVRGRRPSTMPVPPRRPEGGDGIIMEPPVLPPRRRPRRQVGRRMLPRPKPQPRPDDLGPPPEREVPIPKEVLPEITRESDPRGRAPFAPDEKAMAKQRFYERMFERADSKRQQRSMQQEERRGVKQSRRDERRMRMSEPGEININAERRRRRRKRRNLEAFDMLSQEDKNLMTQNTRGRLRRRGRSREDRAMFRNRFAERLRRR